MIHWPEEPQPVIEIPDGSEIHVHKFTQGPDDRCPPHIEFSIGLYAEHRPGMYNSRIFSTGRATHMGIDIGAPTGTEVKAPINCKVSRIGNESAEGGYGPHLVLQISNCHPPLYLLLGHLSSKSISEANIGEHIETGQIIGQVGGEKENGGWPPHLHMQLSRVEPRNTQVPGVISKEDIGWGKTAYPTPIDLLCEKGKGAIMNQI